MVTFSNQFCTTFLTKCLDKFKYINIAALFQIIPSESAAALREWNEDHAPHIPKIIRDMFEVCDKDIFQSLLFFNQKFN